MASGTAQNPPRPGQQASARRGLFQDWSSNPGGIRIRLLLVFFRLVNPLSRGPRWFKLAGAPLILAYKFYTQWIVGIELHWKCTLGPGASIYHGYGLVVHSDTRLGARVKLRNGVTIGMKYTQGKPQVPVIGDDVDIGANAVIIGGVRIGDGATIGAGAVVIRDVPAHTVAVGNPARLLP
ncbi:serine acetyltransferase [Novosphingobium decolorationis]|uniref:Serine acetyltransferase n=1 Tax=Novosphingobium decolorationis TaxID=2698673 RepID=A0ABX8E445_9SPHN|nr:serine acetyltransferase [Novosphingobium decolorationis]QVM83709.1 serine acetyltransferase [Novosphingobium decolorationis]